MRNSNEAEEDANSVFLDPTVAPLVDIQRRGTDRPDRQVVLHVLAYISPTSFVMVLLSKWSVKRLIVSLPRCIERIVLWAPAFAGH